MLLSVAPYSYAGQQIDGPNNPTDRFRPAQDAPRLDRVLKAKDIDTDRRKMLWKDKTVDREGYLRVKSSVEYLKFPESVLLHPNFLKSSSNGSKNLVARGDLDLIGKLNEDQHRVTWALSNKNNNLILTVWKYKAAGAVYSVPEEFLNQKVGGQPAVLSLSYAEKTEKALWKLTWWDKGVMYELYVSDTLTSSGAPQTKPHQIIHIADLALRKVSN